MYFRAQIGPTYILGALGFVFAVDGPVALAENDSSSYLVHS